MSKAAAPAIPALLLVGCGQMGGALLRGWRARHLAERYVIVEPGPGAASFAGEPDVTLAPGADRLPPDLRPSVIVFAVKPQVMGEVLSAYRRFAAGGTLFLSIAAGKTLGFFARQLGAAASVVRAMPNMPAAIGRGIAVACASGAVAAVQRTLAERLLGAVGEVGWVEDEALIDAVTAVSGSGPAYVFLLIECRLRESVTSPGGTTRAALDVLMAPDGLEPLMTRAVLAAARRSRELAD